MPGARLLFAAILAVLTLLPATAHAASTVTRTGNAVFVASTAEEVNRIAIDEQDGLVRIRDTGAAGLAAGEGCAEAGTGVTCGSVATLFRVQVDLGPGDDVLEGSTTSAISRFADGGEGDDVLTGGVAWDRLDGGPGTDTLDGGRGDDQIDGGTDGGTPDTADTVSFRFDRADAGTVWVTMPDAGSTSGGSGAHEPRENDSLTAVENAIGSDGHEHFTDSNVSNRLEGRGGGDTFVMNGGADDEVAGGDGSDHIYEFSAADGDDVYDGGANTRDADEGDHGDRVFYNRPQAVTIALPEPGASTTGNGSPSATESDTFTAIESASGGSGADTITGSSGQNTLEGNAGEDTLDGGAGDDIVDGGAGPDTLRGGADADLLDARNRMVDAVVDCGDGEDRLRADNALELAPRPATCEIVAPGIEVQPSIAGEVRVGKPLAAAALVLSGDAPSSIVRTWWSCLSDAEYEKLLESGAQDVNQCVERARGSASYTPVAADQGRYFWLEVEAFNAAGGHWAESAWTTAVLPPVPVVEEPDAGGGSGSGSSGSGSGGGAGTNGNSTGQDKKVVSRVDRPVVPPAPSPVAPVAPVVRAVAPPVDAFLAVAQRLVGGRARALGSVGPVRAFGAPGRGLALVCTKGSCRVRAGSSSFTLAAGKGRVVKARKGAKVRVTVGKVTKTLRAS